VFVIAGLGPRVQWYRNLHAHEAIEVAIGRERFTPNLRRHSRRPPATRRRAAGDRSTAL
jgi:hypothetical protein